MEGTRLRGPADPTSIVAAPWNSAVILFRETTDQKYTPAIVGARLRKQLGIITSAASPAETVDVSMRMQRVYCWEISGNDIELICGDLDYRTAFRPLFSASDVAGRNRWAHLGFLWPADLRDNVFSEVGEKDVVLFAINTNPGTSSSERIIVHLHLLWRCNKFENLPQSTTSFEIV